MSAKAQTIWLGIIKERPRYCNGSVRIGLYSGKTEDDAKRSLINSLGEEHLPNDIQILGLNERPIEIISIPTTYRDE